MIEDYPINFGFWRKIASLSLADSPIIPPTTELPDDRNPLSTISW
jgi:hypothetical protein